VAPVQQTAAPKKLGKRARKRKSKPAGEVAQR